MAIFDSVLNFLFPRPKTAADEDLIIQAEKSIVNTLFIGLCFGAIGLIGFPLQLAGVGKTLLFLSVLIACASFISGFFIGILFGIPKRNNNAASNYALNNSLVEIADWLTKIIVGLGLVNIKQVPVYLMNMGQYVQKETNIVGTSISVFTMCVVIYFSVFGLYNGYNYMRLVLSGRYKDADDNLIEKLYETQSELLVQKTKNDEVKKSNEILLNKVNEPLKQVEELKEMVLKSETNAVRDVAQLDYIDRMIKQSEEILQEGLEINKKINDPQKRMWGGLTEVGNRKLSANVVAQSKGLYQVSIKLESTDIANDPLHDDDVVLFALHNTWSPPYRLVNVEDGKAQLDLYSFGSFTIGAFVDKGNTKLEIDLAELPGVSRDFKMN